MPVQPLTLQAVVDRIASQCRTDDLYHLVDRAANASAAIASREHAMPAAFVLEPGYSAIGTPNASGSVITARVDYEIGVLTVVKNYGSSMAGVLQSQKAEALRASLWVALVGWSPEATGFSLDLGRGSLLEFDDSVFYYLDTFVLQRRVRNNP